MSVLDEKNSLIMVIDIQEKLLNAVYNKQELEKNSNILLQAASILEIPVIVTEQYPKGLGSTANSLKTILPNETHYFEKNTFSALDNLDIMDALENYNKKQIVLFGI